MCIFMKANDVPLHGSAADYYKIFCTDPTNPYQYHQVAAMNGNNGNSKNGLTNHYNEREDFY